MRLQEIPTCPGSSFYTGAFATPDFNYPYCFHPEFEIFLVRKGNALSPSPTTWHGSPGATSS